MAVCRILLVIGVLAGMTMFGTGCSIDLNNPYADEWDVQIVGDSVFDLSGDIHDVLQDLSGSSYKDRSVSGAKIAAIQSQLNTALKRKTLKTVIADGGANDILQGTMDCDSDPLTTGCIDVLDYIGDKMEVMLEAMYNKSPNDCVWLGYYHVKGDEIDKNEAIDYAYDWIYPDIFASTNMDAVLVDPRDEILPSHIKSDDIHPTYAGSEILANLIWDEMVAGNMYR
ncbi:MAG TPA: SGNH/GDSL hydrolase family protein [Deltaproteobacteria bacterium]|nr:SGNH/GDSL hydrolase family protein [Deltaproteobacteria bacterium]HPR55712.1 SGNH/GDSL hydrolase family protein [Deltaproteobacteria bacterium]HXK47341.1 SGNH/GDSL hydrolase family protein [Deltaproteobacteria bacterium]